MKPSVLRTDSCGQCSHYQILSEQLCWFRSKEEIWLDQDTHVLHIKHPESLQFYSHGVCADRNKKPVYHRARAPVSDNFIRLLSPTTAVQMQNNIIGISCCIERLTRGLICSCSASWGYNTELFILRLSNFSTWSGKCIILGCLLRKTELVLIFIPFCCFPLGWYLPRFILPVLSVIASSWLNIAHVFIGAGGTFWMGQNQIRTTDQSSLSVFNLPVYRISPGTVLHTDRFQNLTRWFFPNWWVSVGRLPKPQVTIRCPCTSESQEKAAALYSMQLQC